MRRLSLTWLRIVMLAALAWGCSSIPPAAPVARGDYGDLEHFAASLREQARVSDGSVAFGSSLTFTSVDPGGSFRAKFRGGGVRQRVQGRLFLDELGYGVSFSVRRNNTVRRAWSEDYELRLHRNDSGYWLIGGHGPESKRGRMALKAEGFAPPEPGTVDETSPGGAEEQVVHLRRELQQRTDEGNLSASARVLDQLEDVEVLTAHDHWLRALYWTEVSRHADARGAYEAAIVAVPDLEAASETDRLVVARSLRALDRSAAALDVIEAHGTASPEWSLERAFAESESGRAEGLVAILAAEDSATTGDAWFRLRLARVFLGAGEPARSVAVLEQLTRELPEFVSAWETLADVHHRMGQTDEALIAAQRAVQLAPESPIAHNVLAAVLQQGGSASDESRALEKAIELEPRFALATANLAGLRIRQGRAADALELARRAVTLDPQLVEAHEVLGRAYWVAGRQSEALSAFDAALVLRPSFSLALVNRAALLCQMERYGPALEAAERALAHVLHPAERVGAALTEARALVGLGRRGEALAVVDALLAEHPGIPDAMALRESLVR